MITEINAYPEDWKKDCWIASKIISDNPSYDDEGNEIVLYEKPQHYKFNYQSVNSDAEIAEFGEKVSMMKKTVIPISYKGKFKAFDVAYLDDINPNEETEGNYGINANYKLLPPRDGNAVIIIYFEKLTGK